MRLFEVGANSRLGAYSNEYGSLAEEGLPTSDFRLPTSDFRLPTSNFRLPISDFRLPTSVAMKGGDRPARLLRYAKMLLVPKTLACIASVSARVRQESWDEGKKKKGMRGEGKGSEGNACPQTPRF